MEYYYFRVLLSDVVLMHQDSCFVTLFYSAYMVLLCFYGTWNMNSSVWFFCLGLLDEFLERLYVYPRDDVDVTTKMLCVSLCFLNIMSHYHLCLHPNRLLTLCYMYTYTHGHTHKHRDSCLHYLASSLFPSAVNPSLMQCYILAQNWIVRTLKCYWRCQSLFIIAVVVKQCVIYNICAND